MQKHSSSGSGSSVLTLSIPHDAGASAQRRRIIEAMIASCAEKTYAETTITDIVAGAKISRTTFYKRFADKRECFEAAVDVCVDELRAAAQDSFSSADSPPDAVLKATMGMLELMAAKPAVAQLLAGDAVSVEPAVVERYRKLLIPALEDLWGDLDGGGPRTDPRLAFGRAQLLVFSEVAAGRCDYLPALLPELVYLALAPFAGHKEAVRQAQLAEAGANSNGTAPGAR
jgi:AcrR family transcriptional regulator